MRIVRSYTLYRMEIPRHWREQKQRYKLGKKVLDASEYTVVELKSSLYLFPNNPGTPIRLDQAQEGAIYPSDIPEQRKLIR